MASTREDQSKFFVVLLARRLRLRLWAAPVLPATVLSLGNRSVCIVLDHCWRYGNCIGQLIALSHIKWSPGLSRPTVYTMCFVKATTFIFTITFANLGLSKQKWHLLAHSVLFDMYVVNVNRIARFIYWMIKHYLHDYTFSLTLPSELRLPNKLRYKLCPLCYLSLEQLDRSCFFYLGRHNFEIIMFTISAHLQRLRYLLV